MSSSESKHEAMVKTKANVATLSSSDDFITYNWPEIKIVSVEYPGQSGMTIFSYINNGNPAKRMSYYLSKRGKDVGGFCTDILNRTPDEDEITNGVHTVVLTGGSTLGLESICGVQNHILQDNIYWYNNILKGDAKKAMRYVPIHERVMGACCFTTNISIDKSFVYPDLQLGDFGMTEVFKLRDEDSDEEKDSDEQKIYLKQNGVGLNSQVAKINAPDPEVNNWMENGKKGGVGARFFEDEDSGLKVLVFINLNSLGVIHDDYKLLHDFNKWKKGTNIKDHRKLEERLENFTKFMGGRNPISGGSPSNTTLSVIITNLELPHDEKKRISEELHQQIEDMIYPYGTYGDGDILFVCSTWDIKYSTENEGILLDKGKELIRESIISVFSDTTEEATGGAGGAGGASEKKYQRGGNLESIYEEKYLKYKKKYNMLKNKL